MSIICDVIKKNFKEKADKRLYLFFDGYEVIENVTYGEFGKRVMDFAGYLQGIKTRGSRALILLPSSVDYLTAYFSCLFSNTVAVPLYEINEEKQIENLKHIIENCDAEYIITAERYVPQLNKWLGDMAEELFICTIDNYVPRPYTEIEINEDDIAYLQYTSGSTKSAKGVRITYGNIYATCRIMRDRLKFCETDVFVTWLPLHFDMGLIGANINPIVQGGSSCFSSADSFMKQPDSWFNAASVYHGTVLIAPNFAYEMCMKLPEETLEKFDFSSVRLTINGSELVRNSTLSVLADKMKRYGLEPDSINPSYGLAENTLVVSTHIPGKGYRYVTLDEAKLRENIISYNDDGLDIVSCGKVCEGVGLSIIDINDGTVLGEDEIGEVIVSGDSVADGYWLDEDDSGFFESEDGEKCFATGDLGFMHDDHLYVVGRKKDMIIIRGKNIYSQDIEEFILNATEGKAATSVAFSVDNGEDEDLIIIVETDENDESEMNNIINKVRTEVAANFGIVPSEVLIRKCGYLPRTDSGKVQRQVCKRQYINSLCAVR